MKRKRSDGSDSSFRPPDLAPEEQRLNGVKKSCGLNLIQAYDDDDDDDDKHSGDVEDSSHGTPQNTANSDGSQLLLPMPAAILGMFGSNQDEEDVKLHHLQKHQGRIRTFPHVRGNWPSFVHIAVQSEGDVHPSVLHMTDLILEVFDTSTQEIHLMQSVHVSLSRTQIFRHHWIQPFVSELQKKLRNFSKFQMQFCEFEALINEEKTRTFIVMRIQESPQLLELVRHCDSCLEEYKLHPYYQNPIFHVSLAWMLGDQIEVMEDFLLRLNQNWNKLLQEETDVKVFDVASVAFKYGDKTALFPLK